MDDAPVARSSPTCRRAATRPCSNTPTRFDRLEARLASPRSRSAAGRNATRRSTALAAAAARGARSRGRAHARLSRAPAAANRLAAGYTKPTARSSGQQVTPLDRVGIYVPGGKAAYPSSVLMNAIPAQGRGRREIVMVVPTPDGVTNPLVLAAAALAGVDRVVRDRRRAGGRRARLRHGDHPRGRQDLGPGNAYVAAAKRRVFGARRHRHDRRAVGDPGDLRRAATDPRLGRDGPVLAGRARRARAGDPAVPGRGASSSACAQIDRRAAADDAARARSSRPRSRPRRADQGARSDEACAIANRIAPEHLELAVADPRALAAADPPRRRDLPRPLCERRRWATTAPGRTTCCRPSRTARFSSPLGVYDFQKRSSVIGSLARRRAQRLGAIAADARARPRAWRRTRAAPSRRDERADEPAAPPSSSAPTSARCTAYHVAAATGPGQARRDGEPVPAAGRARRGDGRDAWPGVAINRYPDAPRGRLARAARGDVGCRGLARVVLGNGSDECIQFMRRSRAKPGAKVLSLGAVVRDVPMLARLRRMRFVGVPLNDDFTLDAGAVPRRDRAGEARAGLARVSEQSDRQPLRPRGDRAHHRRGAGAGGDRRGVPAVRRRHASCRRGRPSIHNLVVMRTVSKLGMAGMRLGLASAAPGVDRTSSTRCARRTTSTC